jgi:geranylgeranyl diphosphate synthase type II
MDLGIRWSSGIVPAKLREYGAIVRDELRHYLPKREPRRYLYDLVADYPQRGGKMMRPSLCIATARAFGASLDEALRSAIAIELMHNALLVHDDIEDESEERRGRPTLHRLHGIALAINAGDLLSLLSLRPLMDNIEMLGPELALRILEETQLMARETAEGQAMELGWRQENSTALEVADYLEMVLKKTCWLATIYPIRIGALIGTRGQADPDAFFRFGFLLGATFQIQDDLLNLANDDGRYGKERGGDLWEGKRTLMLIHLLQHSNREERARLCAVLGSKREDRNAKQIAWINKLMLERGSIVYARQIANRLAGAALHEGAMLFSELQDSPDKRFLEEIVPWVIERDLASPAPKPRSQLTGIA